MGYRDDLTAAQARVADLERQLADLKRQLADLESENSRLRAKCTAKGKRAAKHRHKGASWLDRLWSLPGGGLIWGVLSAGLFAAFFFGPLRWCFALDLEGSFEVVGASAKKWIKPVECSIFATRSRYSREVHRGVELLFEGGQWSLRVSKQLDEEGQPFLLRLSQKNGPTTSLTRGDCRVFDLKVNRYAMGKSSGGQQHYKGHLQLDCPKIVGKVSFKDCR